ncbi:MAG: hypothetical protein R3F35_08935 [Myxococcota bacterium]
MNRSSTLGPARARRARSLSIAAGVALGSLLGLLVSFEAAARTRTFCTYEPFYSGKAVDCGGHLEPACTSGAACDAGHNSYSGSPFPITIDCPDTDWNGPFPGGVIADVVVSSGCYDRRPTCNDCGAAGQIPCPVEAEPICARGCDAGLEPNPTTTLCEIPGSPGSPCGPGVPCADGLTCDPFSGFVCIDKSGVGEPCGINPFQKCDDGLQCTLALVCSHDPAREDEPCDVTAPCADGLYCKPGIPQLCAAYRKPGEGCSVINPCIDGASCEACFTERCHAPFQCFWNANNGAITEQQCRTLYSPGDSQLAQNAGTTMTYTAGNGASAVVAESQGFGFAYGQNGEYGCFTSFCYGVETDVTIGAFISVGEYGEFDSVNGLSWVNAQELGVPGDVLTFSFLQVYAREGLLPVGNGTIGLEESMTVGGGLNPSPFSAGTFHCATVLDPIYGFGGTDWSPPPPPTPEIGNDIVDGQFDVDLGGWTCENGGVCSWVADDPMASTVSGSAEVVSAPGVGGRIYSNCVAVTPGEDYVVDAFIKTRSGVNGSLYLQWLASDTCVGLVSNQTLLTPPPDNVWYRYRDTLTAPPGAYGVRVKATSQGDAASGQTGATQVDAVYLPEPDASLLIRAVALGLLGLASVGRRGRG